MVIRAGDQNARLLDAQVFDQLKILLAGANPGGNLGKFVAQILAKGQGFPILFRIDEKLALPDDAVFPAQPVHQLIEIPNLLWRKGRHGLLPIPEGGIRNPDLIRHILRHDTVVKPRFGDLVIGENIPEQHRLLHILQCVVIIVFLQ